MPQQTVYIRNDDMEKWKSLPNKAEFISNHLNNRQVFAMHRDQVDREIKKAIGTNLCKVHGLPLTAYGKCLQKNCKYS